MAESIRQPEELGEIIDIEAFARADRPPPPGRRYRIRIDRTYHVVNQPSMLGREILALVGKTPETHMLSQKLRGGQSIPIGAEERVACQRRRPSARVGFGVLAGAAVPHAVRAVQHLEVAHADHGSGFHQQHLHAEVGQHLGDGAAAGPRADDHDVVDGRTRRDLRDGPLPQAGQTSLDAASLAGHACHRNSGSKRP